MNCSNKMDEPMDNSLRSKLTLGMMEERSLNFATSPDAQGFQMPHKRPKLPRDPMSHRIIEKRRRDRMNNCLADLSHLIPATYLKQGQGRIEKTEIIEMAICHIKHLQILHMEQTKAGDTSAEKFYMGFRECMNEMMRLLVEKHGFNAADPICVQIMKHLKEQSQHFLPPSGLQEPVETTKTVGQTLDTISGNRNALVQFEGEVELTMKNMTAFEQSMNKSKKTYATPNDVVSRSQSPVTPHQPEYQHVMSSPLLIDDDVVSKDSAFESNYSLSQSDSTNANYSEKYYKQEMERSKEIYKFKSDMKSRFNQNLHIGPEQESNNWPDEASMDEKMKKPKASSAEMDCMFNNSKTNTRPEFTSADHNSKSNDSGTCLSDVQSPHPMSETHVPGFALHSTGTYYVPVIIQPSSVTSVFQGNPSGDERPSFLHPISIPVSFGGLLTPCKLENASSELNDASTSRSYSSGYSGSSVSSEPLIKKKKTSCF